MTVQSIGPSPGAFAQARRWLAQRRAEVTAATEQGDVWSGALLGAVRAGMAGLEIEHALFDGQVLFDARPAHASVPTEEDRWSVHRAQGQGLVILEVCIPAAYMGKEKVEFQSQRLEDLIDPQLVRACAPTAAVYRAPAAAPWNSLLQPLGIQFWLTEPHELQVLWARASEWMKTEWHDGPMRASGHRFCAHDLIELRLTDRIAPDLAWRIHREEQARAATQQASKSGEADSTAQSSLRRALGSLAVMEDHPTLGEQATKAMEELLPLLALSMDGKARLKKLKRAESQARTSLYQGLRTQRISWKDKVSAPPPVDWS